MTSKTIALSGAEIRADYGGGTNIWLRNDGTGAIYASTTPGITAGADGTASIPAGQAMRIDGACGTVYLLGTGSVQLVGSDYTACPFKTSAQSGGSGADDVARAAIEAHAGNTDIHVTAAEKAAWDAVNYSNPNLLINPDFAINQRGGNIYSYSVASGSIDGGFTVDHWISTIVGSGNSGSYNAETHILSGSVLDKNGYYANLCQFIENPVRFAGKTLTFSAGMSELDQPALIQIWRTEGTTTTGVAATHYNLKADKVLTFTMPSDLTEASKIRVVLQTRGSVKLDWAKLELGSAATPFVPPDPATELLRCQRYFTIYKHQNATSSTDKCTIGVGYALTSSIVYAVLPIAAMRSGVAATVSYNGLSLIRGADTVVDYTSVTALEQTDSTVQVAFTVSGQTPGAVYRLRLMDSNAYLAVSKEL